MITINGKEAEIDIEDFSGRVNVHLGGHWLAEFICKKDATTFVQQIEVEGRKYETFNSTNKLMLKEKTK